MSEPNAASTGPARPRAHSSGPGLRPPTRAREPTFRPPPPLRCRPPDKRVQGGGGQGKRANGLNSSPRLVGRSRLGGGTAHPRQPGARLGPPPKAPVPLLPSSICEQGAQSRIVVHCDPARGGMSPVFSAVRSTKVFIEHGQRSHARPGCLEPVQLQSRKPHENENESFNFLEAQGMTIETACRNAAATPNLPLRRPSSSGTTGYLAPSPLVDLHYPPHSTYTIWSGRTNSPFLTPPSFPSAELLLLALLEGGRSEDPPPPLPVLPPLAPRPIPTLPASPPGVRRPLSEAPTPPYGFGLGGAMWKYSTPPTNPSFHLSARVSGGIAASATSTPTHCPPVHRTAPM